MVHFQKKCGDCITDLVNDLVKVNVTGYLKLYINYIILYQYYINQYLNV